MVIVDKITAILKAMEEDTNCDLASWQYEDKPTANVRLDGNKPSPTALLIQITNWEMPTDRLNIREKADINVTFLEKESKMDSGGLQQDAIIDRMKDLAVDFISRLLADKTLKVLDDTVTVKSVFHRSDSNRTGVNISLEVEERQGRCL